MQPSPSDLQFPFDRITYREGQLLASRDLQDDERMNRRLRQLHTRYLHETWGIALGFTVRGQINEDAIHVGTGLALDSSGREILLNQELSLPLPNTPLLTRLMLVATFEPDDAFGGMRDLRAICFTGGLDPRLEKPAFAWRTQDTLRPGSDVPLAAVSVVAGALIANVDLSVRRYADRMARPHLGFGSFDFHPQRSGLYSKVTIDTTDGGFSGVPQYFARLDLLDPSQKGNFPTALVATFGFVDAPAPASFRYNFPFPPLDVLPELKLRLTWLGVETVSGCEPVFSIFNLFSLAGLLLFLTPSGKLSQSLFTKEVKL
jgi:hypothetical protein